MIILGIDPSLNGTGYCVLSCKNDSFEILNSSTIIHKKDLDLYSKIHNIYKEISLISNKYNPEIFSIEETFVNSNPETSLKLGMVRGVFFIIGIESKAKILEYEPRFVKKTITGSGSADKNQISYMIKHMIPKFEPKTLDESDAAAVAITAYIMTTSKFNNA